MSHSASQDGSAAYPSVWPVVSYAGHFEDVLLGRVFKNAPPGFYVDVGASDPLAGSTTRHFYNRGWRGINIEPSHTFDRFPSARPEDINLNVAASDRNGEATFLEFVEHIGVSNLGNVVPSPLALEEQHNQSSVPRRTRTVKTRRLVDIFDQYEVRNIDFISIDVEGHERQVLLGNDWRRYRPKMLVIEAVVPCQAIPTHELWEGILKDNDYRDVYFDGVNRYYVRGEDYAEVAPHFTVPVNPFDYYCHAKLAELESETVRLRSLLDARNSPLWKRTLSRLRNATLNSARKAKRLLLRGGK